MSKNRIKSAIALQTVVALMIPSISNAGIVGIHSSGSSNSGQSSGPSGSVVLKPSKPVDEKVEIKEGTAGVACKSDPDASTYFPLDFFQHISRDGSSLSFEARDNNKVMVKIPASLDICGKFKAQLYQDKSSMNVTIMMVNDQGKTYGEYLKCLEDAKVLVDGKIDHDKIESKNYSQYSYVLDYDFDKNKDVTRSVKMTFGYPTAFQYKDGYPSTYGIDNSVELPSSRCMYAEKIANETTFLNKGRDEILKDLNEICKGKNAQKIAEARRSIGNIDALKDIADKVKAELDAGYLRTVKENDVPRIYDAMTKIEDKINKDNKILDEAASKKLVKQYADLAKELDSKFLNPAVMHLDELMKQRAALSDEDPSIKGIDDEIKKLNEDISKFAGRNSTSLINLYSLMEKFSINDQAKVIEDIRLKSYLYSKVFVSGSSDDRRGKAITFDEANQKQIKGMQNFEKTLNDWQDVYLVGQGSMVPIKKVESARTQAINKMNGRWAAYQQSEQQQYYQYCGTGMTGGVSNPIQCQTFLKGVASRQQQQLKMRERDLKYIKTTNDKLSKMGISYNDYQKKEAEKAQSEQDAVDPWGSSYSGSETTFEERFPQYAGPTTSTSFDTWQYSPQNPAMSMGVNPNGLQTGYSPGYTGPGMSGMVPQQGYAYQMQPQGMYRQ